MFFSLVFVCHLCLRVSFTLCLHLLVLLAFSLAYVSHSCFHFCFHFGRHWFSLTVSMVYGFLPRFHFPSLSLCFIHFIFAFTGFARVYLGHLHLLVWSQCSLVLLSLSTRGMFYIFEMLCNLYLEFSVCLECFV